MTDKMKCGNHQPVRCAWAQGLWQIWGRKEDGTNCCHEELFTSHKEAVAKIIEMDGVKPRHSGIPGWGLPKKQY
jgi:hypothetical protein